MRRGPRTDGGAGREHILQAALARFGEAGYQATTIRRVAESAGVDPKLVHYYFGSKETLFTTVITETFRARGLPDLLVGGDAVTSGSLGENYLRAVLDTLEDPGIGTAMIGLARSLGTHEESRRVFLGFTSNEILGRLAPRLDVDMAETRIALAGSQLLGIVMARYVLKLPPLAALSPAEVARLVAWRRSNYTVG